MRLIAVIRWKDRPDPQVYGRTYREILETGAIIEHPNHTASFWKVYR
jgi:hypothetical protein